MTLQLYFHPFSSYCQKALVALYEHAIPFRFSIEQPPAECDEPIKSTIIAHYRLNGIDRQSHYEVRVTRKGLLIDPR